MYYECTMASSLVGTTMVTVLSRAQGCYTADSLKAAIKSNIYASMANCAQKPAGSQSAGGIGSPSVTNAAASTNPTTTSSSSTTSSSTAGVIGGVVGGAIGLSAILAGVYFLKRRSATLTKTDGPGDTQTSCSTSHLNLSFIVDGKGAPTTAGTPQVRRLFAYLWDHSNILPSSPFNSRNPLTCKHHDIRNAPAQILEFIAEPRGGFVQSAAIEPTGCAELSRSFD